jgi:hypothetical protein
MRHSSSSPTELNYDDYCDSDEIRIVNHNSHYDNFKKGGFPKRRKRSKKQFYKRRKTK